MAHPVLSSDPLTIPEIVLLEPNQVWRTYPGGRVLDTLEGKPEPADTHFREDDNERNELAWLRGCSGCRRCVPVLRVAGDCGIRGRRLGSIGGSCRALPSLSDGTDGATPGICLLPSLPPSGDGVCPRGGVRCAGKPAAPKDPALDRHGCGARALDLSLLHRPDSLDFDPITRGEQP